MFTLGRRAFLKAGLAATTLAALDVHAQSLPFPAAGRVVIVGAGFAGATCARYLRLWSGGKVQVTLVERRPALISCPLSNLVLAGTQAIDRLTLSYDALSDRWGVRLIRDEVTDFDIERRLVRLAGGEQLPYDRLVLAPGIDFLWEELPALAESAAREHILHAWKAGPQTLALRRQLLAMPDGGLFVLTIPKVPYRCPPGPYERACLVADYFKRHKPRSKVIILDANDDVVSKKALFVKAWQELYPGLIEYRPGSELKDVDLRERAAVLDFDRQRADVLNVIPPQRAGSIASRAGIKLLNQRWAEVDWLSMAATGAPGVHVIGDAVFPAPTMPKSAHMANQHGKLAAAAILRGLAGEPPGALPMLTNTCYSFVDPEHAIHVSSVHRYDAASRTLQPVPGAGGVSSVRNEAEGKFAWAWARNIWADTLL
ncbi:MAG TPA: NAD(P)/FAD-dependent oxidoreductase [Accumulibacter sp.]|nr:NAD(P)/FAD-dependent oxidoreductase [Accumulibacter sp.]